MTEPTHKICSRPDCPHGGILQPIENFEPTGRVAASKGYATRSGVCRTCRNAGKRASWARAQGKATRYDDPAAALRREVKELHKQATGMMEDRIRWERLARIEKGRRCLIYLAAREALVELKNISYRDAKTTLENALLQVDHNIRDMGDVPDPNEDPCFQGDKA